MSATAQQLKAAYLIDLQFDDRNGGFVHFQTALNFLNKIDKFSVEANVASLEIINYLSAQAQVLHDALVKYANDRTEDDANNLKATIYTFYDLVVPDTEAKAIAQKAFMAVCKAVAATNAAAAVAAVEVVNSAAEVEEVAVEATITFTAEAA
jgi:hypothetical protein